MFSTIFGALVAVAVGVALEKAGLVDLVFAKIKYVLYDQFQ